GMQESESELLRAAFCVKYWFCVEPDGSPLLFEYNNKPEKVPNRGWQGEWSATNHEISKESVTSELLKNVDYETEPVEVCFSPLEKIYYRFDYKFEESRHRNLFPELYREA
ncbi:MAG: hypothetical protein JXK16_02960, partial [Thiotrichales bacterium]|nr:hypothetical protein [Thiotrichales bacterium]